MESCIVTVGLTSLGIHGPKPIGLGPDKFEFKGDLVATRKRINEKFQISDQFPNGTQTKRPYIPGYGENS